jgi:hypothetical protein
MASPQSYIGRVMDLGTTLSEIAIVANGVFNNRHPFCFPVGCAFPGGGGRDSCTVAISVGMSAGSCDEERCEALASAASNGKASGLCRMLLEDVRATRGGSKSTTRDGSRRHVVIRSCAVSEDGRGVRRRDSKRVRAAGWALHQSRSTLANSIAGQVIRSFNFRPGNDGPPRP